MATTSLQPIEQLQQRGQEIVSLTQSWVEDTRDRGVALYQQVKARAEQELARTRGQLQEVEQRTQELVQARVRRGLSAMQSLEHQTVERVEHLLSQVRRQVDDNAPALSPLLARVQDGLDKADKAFKTNVGIATETLPVADYDQLNVRSILRALSKLTPAQLELVKTYESNHKNRITILTEIHARLASPFFQ